MDFCYVWLRRLVRKDTEGFDRPSTRSPDELTGNVTQDRGIEHFTDGLSEVYSRMANALKPGAPLVFTYHHNKLDAYCAVGVAILDAGLVCSASLPCPAEMGGSIHIHGTTSSIVDTVFVCRASGARLREGPAIRLARATGRDREQGYGTTVGSRKTGHPRRHPMHRFRSPNPHCRMAATNGLGSLLHRRRRNSTSFRETMTEYGDPDETCEARGNLRVT